MKRHRILFSGLGGSLFPYLHQQLTSDFDLVYIDTDKSLKRLYPELNFHPAPLVLAPEYPTFVKKLIREENIEWYVPLIDEEIAVAYSIVKDTDCRLVSPSLAFTQLCLHKLNLMRKLEKLGISTIRSWRGDKLPANATYPLFVKPLSGRGSRGIFRIDSVIQYEAYLRLHNYKAEELIVQEYIEGQEYTVGVLANRGNDVLCISSRKVLDKRGVTIRAVTENNSSIDRVVKEIQRNLQPNGPYNIQLYLTEAAEIKIFEINPRFSTTLVMSYAGGVNELKLYVNNEYDFDQSIQRPREFVELRRSWQNNFI